MSGRPRTTSFAEQNKQANQHPILGMKVTSKYLYWPVNLFIDSLREWNTRIAGKTRAEKKWNMKKSRMMEQRTPSEKQVKMAAERRKKSGEVKKKTCFRVLSKQIFWVFARVSIHADSKAWFFTAEPAVTIARPSSADFITGLCLIPSYFFSLSLAPQLRIFFDWNYRSLSFINFHLLPLFQSSVHQMSHKCCSSRQKVM